MDKARTNSDRPNTDSAEQDAEASGQFRFAAKLARLFATRHPAGRGPYTLREVAELVTKQELEKPGQSDEERKHGKISFSYLSQLRSGSKSNPSFRHVAALAEFFGVPLSYFTRSATEVDRIDEDLAITAAMHSRELRDLLLEASNMTPAGMQILTAILQGLKNVPGMFNRQGRSRADVKPDPGVAALSR